MSDRFQVTSRCILLNALSNKRVNLIPQSVYVRAQKKYTDTQAQRPWYRTDVTANLTVHVVKIVGAFLEEAQPKQSCDEKKWTIIIQKLIAVSTNDSRKTYKALLQFVGFAGSIVVFSSLLRNYCYLHCLNHIIETKKYMKSCNKIRAKL